MSECLGAEKEQPNRAYQYSTFCVPNSVAQYRESRFELVTLDADTKQYSIVLSLCYEMWLSADDDETAFFATTCNFCSDHDDVEAGVSTPPRPSRTQVSPYHGQTHLTWICSVNDDFDSKQTSS